jgi:hypothetical protein
MQVKATLLATGVACVEGVGRRAYQPVVVRRPLAREGRGLRGLCTPVAVTGITKTVWHTEATSLRGRVFASGMMDC